MLLDVVPEEEEGSSTHEGSSAAIAADESRPPTGRLLDHINCLHYSRHDKCHLPPRFQLPS